MFGTPTYQGSSIVFSNCSTRIGVYFVSKWFSGVSGVQNGVCQRRGTRHPSHLYMEKVREAHPITESNMASLVSRQPQVCTPLSSVLGMWPLASYTAILCLRLLTNTQPVVGVMASVAIFKSTNIQHIFRENVRNYVFVWYLVKRNPFEWNLSYDVSFWSLLTIPTYLCNSIDCARMPLRGN